MSLEIPEEDVDLEIDEVEEQIITVLNEEINIGTDYVFCDNETDIKYTTDDIIKKE